MATQWTAGLTDATPLPAATLNRIGAAWETWTPTLTQGVTVTKTITYAAYAQINKIVIANLSLICTSGGTAGQNIVVGLPPIAVKQTTNLALGSGLIYDSSANVLYNVTAQSASSSTFISYYNVGNPIGNNPALTLASGDAIQFFLMYEAA